MQALDLCRERPEVALVRDEVVGGRATRGAIGLRRELGACLRQGRSVAGLQAADLGGLVRVDDQHPVNMRARTAFDQQRDGEDLVGPAGPGRARLHFGADRRMGQCLKLAPRGRGFGRVAEYPGAQGAAVERAVRSHDRITELGTDLRQEPGTGGDHVARDLVGVDDRHAERREETGDGALAARDAAGEADAVGHEANMPR